MSVRKFIDIKDSKITYPMIFYDYKCLDKPMKTNFDRKMYIGDHLIDNIDKNIDNYVTKPSDNSKSIATIYLIDEIWETVEYVLSDHDLKKPISDFLASNDIRRACWSLSGQWIDPKNTMFTLNHLSQDLVGHLNHCTEICSVTQCDLVSYYDKCYYPRKRIYGRIHNRWKYYSFKFVTDNRGGPKMLNHEKKFEMSVPVISTKDQIIRIFLDNLKEDVPEEFVGMDFDLCVFKKLPFSYLPSQIKRKVDTDEHFIVDCYQHNQHDLRIINGTQIIYVIIGKISFVQICRILGQKLPKDLSRLVYEYGNFGSYVRKNNWENIFS